MRDRLANLSDHVPKLMKRLVGAAVQGTGTPDQSHDLMGRWRKCTELSVLQRGARPGKDVMDLNDS
jgi:hypothetical protein